jgi:response regulator RpfG family c-di-GMP phosphodiesterase
MPTIINMQTRSLTDEEKEFILMHPRIGVDYLENDNDFLPYMDIILGHHKSYDGKSGYPKEFNNTASPYRIITDVISICDALEIGEDYISRAYKAPKKFDEIVEEIYEGAGTLYNPYIAEMIERDDDLREKLRYIVTEGRIKATQEVYRNIVTCVRYGGSPYFRLNAVDMENEEEQ